ncbi:2-dehydropantoate 2-reductase [Secundilactobacillus paracollinoides]|uniref:ketopantoate reductase family protein n=1 Tax=Secundilactobacillus paracollinoides TaxID=240427 RepID=UPI00081A78D8|nr:ketopantoate reductase family protein [Secundilactobacillus paracollinoides]ANZ64606.1 2-dehydropantoate 2-reductase [Secundilactobacillus paracollinoides]
MTKYTVIGAGAMGLGYGVLMQERTANTVDFVDTWKPSVETIKEQGGVWVSRDHKDKHMVPVNISYPEDYTGDPDVWIIFVKQMQLADVLKRCAPLFKAHQYVFSAMNGMGHIDKISNYFPDEHIVGGTAMIATVLNGPGDVDFMGAACAGEMHMVNKTEHNDETTQQIFTDFKDAGMGPIMTENFMGTLMSKVVFNAVTNTLCSMFEITMGQFIEYPGVKDMTIQLMNESFDACERAGIHLVETRQEEVASVDYVSRVANPYHYPSMYQDFSKGRPTEVDYINGYIAKIGREHDYVCRTHEFITHEVHMAELMRKYKKQPAEQTQPVSQA